MKLYTIGCSFTHGHQLEGDPQGGWPRYLADLLTADLTNHGYSGAGNTYISNKPILHGIQDVDLVAVMWSGLTRKDLLIDTFDPTLVNALSRYDYCDPTKTGLTYVFSGGLLGSWQRNPFLKNIFDPVYRSSTNNSMAAETLLNILQLQTYLKQQSIPYVMSSYMNYWGTQPQVGDFDFGLAQFHNLHSLIDQIDFDQWVFLDSDRNGIFELAQQTPGGLQPDGVHPTYKVHELWAEIVYEKVKKLNIL